jgi:hypothetical protein
MRVLDTVSGLVQLSSRFRQAPGDETVEPQGGTPAAPLEARLAGVVVAALQEAFDRDRARMDLERSQVETEQRRAAEALAAELRRQAVERSLGQLRLVAIIAVAAWMLSAALAVWLPGMREGLPRLLLGGGWGLAFGALGCAFAGSQRTSAWIGGAADAAVEPPGGAPATACPWLLLGALALVAAALLLAL